ncbi:class I SAM-dependent methyltransferase [Corallococcus sp. ZKHCc1 1396]|uniref:Class I SAM-dependent methyltransferase n=1 Tax=Corallococcus soli TaxID=2710757 RepID=A0ABR9PKG7_9BACT|nr:class I SAM-dependent methyltransferase [Corallococcus soli]MBE4748402.1 class I SAM-dependent methyltransferase [Corallococcus soli]
MSVHESLIRELYDRLAERYIADRRNAPWNERPWLEKFLTHIPPDGSVLDLGCGAGTPIGGYLLSRGRAVTGIDTSPRLIAHCRATLLDGDWRVADMRTLALSRQFHGVIAWDSFFHLGHDAQRAMFPVFRDHALPGAMLMFTSGADHGEAYGDYHGETLYHSSLAPEEYTRRLADNGFSVVERVFNDPDCGDHCVWLAQRTH